jgi:hypothetical protein
MMSLFALAVIATYDCEVAKPTMITNADGKMSTATLGFPAEVDKWKFTVTVESGDPPQATIAWPGNPLKAEGKFPALPTSGGSIAIVAAGPKPCVLTEGGCLNQISIVNTGETSAAVQIVPVAIGKTAAGAVPLLVVSQGTCKRGGAAQ